MKHLAAPVIEVKELEELPEQWRSSKLAWLCKELLAHKAGTLVRILNAQRKGDHPVQGCLDEACGVYNRMIRLGGYLPRFSLHNSLF
ncbi:hypothetical protein F3Y22_tig00111392pilonHSYRG00139 [Hibiscus syriacus]|uniref:Uncharacterized protein n=1 Tax=Hibiscus syriacus TaxID=106335 RepID=A0A6A2YHU8_HIBSY|nr:hypothetical protein F3Y22_tig00111392pilonHSYRG00139 [Hibiscus syriacus]